MNTEVVAPTQQDVTPVVAAPPHVRDALTIPGIMGRVLVSCLPVAIGAAYFQGGRALLIMTVGILAALLTEILWQKLLGRPQIVGDGSAAVTGLLLALTLPPGAPLWMPAAGSIFGILVGKQLLGGLGQNVFNPALLGRAFLAVSWPGLLSLGDLSPLVLWKKAVAAAIGVNASGQTAAQARQTLEFLTSRSYLLSYFWGNSGNLLGDCSTVLVLFGAGYLLWGRWVKWRIPLAYALGFALSLLLSSLGSALGPGEIIFHFLNGGVVLAMFFLATDPVTTPMGHEGQIVFGLGAGVLSTVFRWWSPYLEGFTFSILLMNAAVPYLDRRSGRKPSRSSGASQSR